MPWPNHSQRGQHAASQPAGLAGARYCAASRFPDQKLVGIVLKRVSEGFAQWEEYITHNAKSLLDYCESLLILLSIILGKRLRETASVGRRMLRRKIRVPISNNEAGLSTVKPSITVTLLYASFLARAAE